MKAGRLIELLEGVSPDAEVMCCIESCWDENNPGDVRSFDERLKQKLTPEEYELITSWR